MAISAAVLRTELPLADNQTVVRIAGQYDAARHVGTVVTDSEFDTITQPYRLLCTGRVVDVMAYASPLATVTCAACIQRLRPEFARFNDAARHVGAALGVEGAAGGWIYPVAATKPLTQGWDDFIARWAPRAIERVRAQEGQPSDWGYRYRVNAPEVARLAALPAWRRLQRRSMPHAPRSWPPVIP